MYWKAWVCDSSKYQASLLPTCTIKELVLWHCCRVFNGRIICHNTPIRLVLILFPQGSLRGVKGCVVEPGYWLGSGVTIISVNRRTATHTASRVSPVIIALCGLFSGWQYFVLTYLATVAPCAQKRGFDM